MNDEYVICHEEVVLYYQMTCYIPIYFSYKILDRLKHVASNEINDIFITQSLNKEN
jgi:hypothetical protein